MFSLEIRPLGHFLFVYVSYLKGVKKIRHDECTLARRNSPAYLIRSTLVAIKYSLWQQVYELYFDYLCIL